VFYICSQMVQDPDKRGKLARLVANLGPSGFRETRR
jgi:hypothetical protein